MNDKTTDLLRRINLVVCDGDGWAKEPERARPGYALTEEGRSAAQHIEERRAEELRRYVEEPTP